MVYIIVLLLSLGISSFHGSSYLGKKNTMKFIAASLPFWAITLLRYDVGTDYMQYLYGYYYYGTGESRGKECVFQWLIDISHYFDFPFLMITLFGTMICLMTFYCIYRKSDNIKQSILLFYFSGFFILSLSMMRQSAITALFFVAFCFFLKRKYVFYFALTIVGALIHSTGYVYVGLGFVFLVLLRFKFLRNLLKPTYLLLFAIVAFLLGGVLREQLMLLTESAGTYSGYFGSDQDSQNASGTFLLYGITPFVSYFLASIRSDGLKRARKERPVEYIVYTILCWLSLVTGLLRPLIPNGERIVFLFEPICILSIPFFVHYARYKKLSLYLSYGGLAACTLWYYYVKISLKMLPYHFIFWPDVNIW